MNNQVYRREVNRPSELLLDEAGVAVRREYTRVALQKAGRVLAGFVRSRLSELNARNRRTEAASI